MCHKGTIRPEARLSCWFSFSLSLTRSLACPNEKIVDFPIWFLLFSNIDDPLFMAIRNDRLEKWSRNGWNVFHNQLKIHTFPTLTHSHRYWIRAELTQYGHTLFMNMCEYDMLMHIFYSPYNTFIHIITYLFTWQFIKFKITLWRHCSLLLLILLSFLSFVSIFFRVYLFRFPNRKCRRPQCCYEIWICKILSQQSEPVCIDKQNSLT